MKELSVKEKAKAYDKVREKIALRFGSNVSEEIFSEYEESEDERIRKELLEAGMIEGRELIYALPKALNDYRFSWTDENKMVLVRGN